MKKFLIAIAGVVIFVVCIFSVAFNYIGGIFTRVDNAVMCTFTGCEQADPISEQQIQNLGTTMLNARNNLQADVKGDEYKQVQVDDPQNPNQKIQVNEAEIHIRAIMQTDLLALESVNVTESDMSKPEWKDTNLGKTWQYAATIKAKHQSDPDKKGWTFDDWVMNARMDVYRCYLTGETCSTLAKYGLIKPEDYNVLTHLKTETTITYYCVEVDTPKPSPSPTPTPSPAIKLTHHTDTTVEVDKDKSCPDPTETDTMIITWNKQSTTTVKTSAAYPNLIYDVLYHFKDYSLLQKDKTYTDEEDGYQSRILFYLDQMYQAEMGYGLSSLPPASLKFIIPMMAGTYTAGDGFYATGHAGAIHGGVDLVTSEGTPVFASGNGTVVYAGDDGTQNYGKWVMIKHNNPQIYSIYGHLSEIDVHINDTVKQGQFIGLSGNTGSSTGPHLHFELCEQAVGTPMNPEMYCSPETRKDPESPEYGMNFRAGSVDDKKMQQAKDFVVAYMADHSKNMMPGLDVMMFGQITEREESDFIMGSCSNNAPMDTAGLSCGAYQFTHWLSGTHTPNTLPQYVLWLDSNYPELYAYFEPYVDGNSVDISDDPNGPFAQTFRKVSQIDPVDFHQSQYIFAMQQYYYVLSSMLLPNFDLSKHGRAVKEIAFSTAINFGPGGAKNIFVSSGAVNETDDSKIIDMICDRRISSYPTLKNRYNDERVIAKQMLIQPDLDVRTMPPKYLTP